jgi:hypothetical protein
MGMLKTLLYSLSLPRCKRQSSLASRVEDGRNSLPQVSIKLTYWRNSDILIHTPEGNRKRVFLCLCCGVFAQFSGTSLTGYYLHNILEAIGIDSPNYQNKLNGFILMVNMIEAWVWASMSVS